MTYQSALCTLCMQQLQLLNMTTDGLRIAAVCSTDGFPIALINNDQIPSEEKAKTTAMAAALNGLCKTIANDFDLGVLEGTVLDCTLGLALCRPVHSSKRSVVMFIVMEKEVTYGHALWTIKNAAKNLAESIKELVNLPLSETTNDEEEK